MKINSPQPLTRRFIEKNISKVNWNLISSEQILSESFIEKYKNRVNWAYISADQKLSEAFIEKFKDKVDWYNICKYQKLSEEFIEKLKDKVHLHWYNISRYQKLSKDFIKKYKEKIIFDLIPRQKDNRTLKIKMKNMKAYAKKYNLEIKDNYLYAFREHDQWNRGMFNKTVRYDKPGIYRDWKCDLNEYGDNSYGLGIFPDGNVKVRVHVKDWGVWAKYTDKGRVWAFELLKG